VALPDSLRWVLTVAFVLASAFHLTRVPRVPGPAKVSEALHLTMGLSMIAMLWPWGAVVPLPAWVGVFTVAALWFAVRTRLTAGRRLVPAFFATTMATTVWMALEMPAEAAAPAMADMPDMPAMSGPVPVVSAILGAYLVVAAFWWFARGLRLGTLAAPAAAPRLGWSSLCHGVMCIGMGFALLAMA